MPWRSWAVSIVLAIILSVGSAACAEPGPFDDLAGTWSGSGIVKMIEGGRDKIKCKATYELPSRTVAKLHLICASDAYKITLIGAMEYRDGMITGSWTETTRNMDGNFTGRVSGNQLFLNTSGIFAAALTVTTTGARQTVLLKLDGAKVQSVSITMNREDAIEKARL